MSIRFLQMPCSVARQPTKLELPIDVTHAAEDVHPRPTDTSNKRIIANSIVKWIDTVDQIVLFYCFIYLFFLKCQNILLVDDLVIQ